jgi:type IV pilus assembly protein PilQ
MKRLSAMLLAAAVTLGSASVVRADDPKTGEVTGVSVQFAPGRANFVIDVRGDIEVRDFLLASPDRLVLDLKGASLGATAGLYDGVNRGGIKNVRYSQFKPDVVRIVLDLDAAKAYKVDRSAGTIRVSFDANRTFVAWSAASAAALDDEELAIVDDLTAEAVAAEAVPAPVRPEVVLGRRQLPRARADEPRITVTWDRASVADVIAGFAAFSGRTIILGKDVKGEVTAEIKNQPWPQAFEAVLATQGLSAQEMPSGIIRVDAPSALAALDSLEPLETSVVRVNYAQAGSLAKTVESILTKNRGRVVADTASNSLIVTDTRSRVGSVTDFIRGLDIRTPQIAIQAKIIFVDRTDIEQLGVKYDLGSSTQFFNKIVQRQDPTKAPGETFDKDVNVVDLGGNSLSGVANADATIPGSALDLIFSTALGGFTLTGFLQALERTELSDVQAEPTISTLDNRQADILVGDEIPVRIIDASSAASGGAPKATVQFKQTGIRLTVTPHVTSNRQILMDLRTERSAIRELAASDLGFSIQTQKAENRLLVGDGETAVIGGLTVTQVTKTRSGIPLLSGLPFVGKLFSYSSETENRRDLIILVTPRIIDDGATP